MNAEIELSDENGSFVLAVGARPRLTLRFTHNLFRVLGEQDD